MQRHTVTIALILFLLPVIGYAQELETVIQRKDINGKEFIYKTPDNYEHTHRGDIYYHTDKDSVLLASEYGYFDSKTQKVIKNGYYFVYNLKTGEVDEKDYYNMDYIHGDDPNNIGKGHFDGWRVRKIPIFEYKTIDKNASATDEVFRTMAEGSIVNESINSGFYYDLYENKIEQGDSQGTDDPKMTWWLPNLLAYKDTTYHLARGLDFTLDFTPQKGTDTDPLIVILGNSPQGYYYLDIHDDGMISFGSRTNKNGTLPILNISKSTKIHWGEKNHIRFQTLENGNFYLEINDYRSSFERLKYQKEVLHWIKNTINPGWLPGVSNRIVARTEMQIDYIALNQLQLVTKSTEDKHPYNGFYKDVLQQITDKIIEKTFAQDASFQLKKNDIYLINYDDSNYDDDIAGANKENTVSVMCNVTFKNKNDYTTNTRPLAIRYVLDDATNALKKADIRFDMDNPFSFSANKIYEEIFELKPLDGFYLQDGMLFHPNSRKVN